MEKFASSVRNKASFPRNGMWKPEKPQDSLLEDIKASLNQIYHEQQWRDNDVTAEKVKN